MKMSSSKIIYVGISLILLVLPLLYLPSGFNPYEFPKFIFFTTVTYLLILYWAINRLKKSQGLKISKLGLLPMLIISFGVINFIADITGLDPKTSLIGSMWRYQGFLLLITGISFFFLVRHVQHSFSLLIVSSFFLVCLFALWQAFSSFVLSNYIPLYQGRIVGTFGNPNFLAGYAIMLLPFILFQQLNNRHKFRTFCHCERNEMERGNLINGDCFVVPSRNDDCEIRNRKATIFLKIVAIVLATATIIITQSQSAALASIIIVLFFVIFTIRRLLTKIKKIFIIVLAIFFIIILVTLSGVANFNKEEYEQFEPYLIQKGEKSCMIDTDIERLMIYFYQKNLFFLQRKSYCENRILIWAQGLKAFYKSPILGYGQENYELIFPKNLMKADNAHNIFLEIAVSSGIIGLMLFIAIIIATMREATVAVRLSLLAFLIVAQFNPLSTAQIMFFWFLLGLKKALRQTRLP